jgi:hypothetical protein
MATRSRVGDILLKHKVLDPLQMRSALARLDQWGGRLGKIAVDLGFANEDAVVEALAKELFLKRIQLGQVPKDLPALRKLDAHYCEENAVFPVSLKDNGKTLVLAVADPTDLQLVDEVAMRARARVLVMCAGESEIQSAIARYYHDRAPGHLAGSAPHGLPLEPSGIELDPSALQGNGFFTGGPSERFIDPGLLDAPEETDNQRSAGQLLEEILSPAMQAERDELDEEARARLATVQENQQKSGQVLRALIELLEDKGALQRGELEGRSRR